MMGDVSGTSNGMSEYPPCPCGVSVCQVFWIFGHWNFQCFRSLGRLHING